MKASTLFGCGFGSGAAAAFLFLAVDVGRSITGDDVVQVDRDSSADANRAPAFEIRLPLTSSDRAVDAGASALQTSTEVALVSERAFTDAERFFVNAEAAASIDDLIPGLEVLLATDPERVFQIVARHHKPDESALEALYLRVVRAMADRNLFATIARMQPLAVGERRDPILSSIAAAYAVGDPDDALAWALSVEPLSIDAVGKVIETVAVVDFLRAFEMTHQIENTVLSADGLGAVLASAALRGDEAPSVLASALAGRGGEDADDVLNWLMTRWVLQDPDGTMEWVASNEVYLSEELMQGIAARLTFEDVGLAAAYADRVPLAYQDQWIGEVAYRYGQFDIDAALIWLPQFRARAGYEEMLSRMLIGGTIMSPQAVADYIETSGATVGQDAVAAAGSALVYRDPQAAADWALRLSDPERSSWAVEGVVGAWVYEDPDAAERWVLDRPAGASRDRVLDSMILGGVLSADFDPTGALAAYDSAAAAQRTLADFIDRSTTLPARMPVPVRDAVLDRAEELVNSLTDPAARERALEQIADAR